MTIKTKSDSAHFVASEYLICMRDFALSHHIPIKHLLADCQQDANYLLSPPKKVDELTMSIISRNLFKSFDIPFKAAILFGKSMGMSSHGALGLAIQGCKQLKDVAGLTQQYFQTRSSGRVIDISTHDQKTNLRFNDHDGIEIPQHLKDVRFYTSVSTLINIDQLIKDLLSHHCCNDNTVLHIPHDKPNGFLEADLPNGLNILFNQPYLQLAIPDKWMRLPLKQGDLDLAKMATNECESSLNQLSPKDLISQIYKTLDDTPSMNVSLQSMSKQLNMSVSTLQRRLKERDTSYQEIKSQVRMNQAKALLRHTHQTLDLIADALGFSDASNFSKSFKSQIGYTPREYRQQSNH